MRKWGTAVKYSSPICGFFQGETILYDEQSLNQHELQKKLILREYNTGWVSTVTAS